MSGRCNGLDKSGKPCKFPQRYEVDGRGLCAPCASRVGHEPAKADMAARGKKGTASLADARERNATSRTSLRSTDDCLTVLEGALRDAKRSGGDLVARAKAITSIVSEARATLKAAELERENTELKQLLLERHPELRKHLKIA